ncbi:hypothetical protein RB195_002275 [Necator americanus]
MVSAKGCSAEYECMESKCDQREEAEGMYTAEHCCCAEDNCNVATTRYYFIVLVVNVVFLVYFDFIA